MRIAARDVSRLSRIVAGCAGVAVAALGAVALLTPASDARPAAALLPAGLALLLAALPGAGRAVRLPGLLLAAAATALGAAALPAHPAAGVATVLAGLALATLDVRLPGRRGGPPRHRVADPLLVGAATIALVALVPRMFAPTFPDGREPGGVMSPYVAGALLTWALGAVLARPESGPLRTAAAAGPGTVVRRALPALIAAPVIAALVSALAVRTGVSRPAAAVSTGAILAALCLLGLIAHLVRTREGADRQQRELAAELHGVDIADRKQAEEELSAHAAELARGNEQLREAVRRLEEALTFKNDLTSMLTHDVAQPISSIASLAELLSEDWADLPDDIRQELATKIDKNTRRLIKMMNDLQLLFRLDTGSVTARRTPVPLYEVVQGVVAAAGGAGDVEVAIGEEVSALADRGHLAAVVQNLLGNALTYGAAPVRVHAAREGDVVVVTVEDRGPGIAEALLPDLFGRFVRGAGLGLFIVRHLVEANGGTVRYEPAEPRGARLVVTWESALPGPRTAG